MSSIQAQSEQVVRTTQADLVEARRHAERMSQRRLNENHPELQARFNEWIRLYLERVTYFVPSTGERIDYPRHGQLAELLYRTPCRIYDLPELKAVCDTAFVDTTGRLYMADSFYLMIEAEQIAGYDTLYIVLEHEMEHLRRVHLQRMLDMPPDIANAGQDIRINCDLLTCRAGNRYQALHGCVPTAAQLEEEVKALHARLGDSLRAYWVFNEYSAYVQWNGKSEEEIAAEFLKTWPKKQQKPDATEISFPALCEGVAQDLDAMELIGIAAGNTTGAQAFHTTSLETRAAGKAKGKLTSQQIGELYVALDAALQSPEMTARGLQHTALVSTANGNPVKSVASGDEFVDHLQPVERISALKQVLEMILKPSNASSAGNSSSIQIKDLELPRTNAGTDRSQDGSQPGGAGSQDGSQSSGIYAGDEHVMDAQKLADILKKAGVHDAAKALGYDDLDKISEGERAAKVNVVDAINRAEEDMHRIGSVYPGGHLVTYSVAQLNSFYKPRLSMKLAIQKVIEELGNKTRFEHDEPWMQYYSSPEEQGLDSEADIGYMGSFVLGGQNRPLVMFIIDTSGSVTEKMVKRFISESIHSAREADFGNTAPEIVIVFADTVARGKPVYINTENYRDFLTQGINYGGRGGTNFTASVQNAFRMVSPYHAPEFEEDETLNRLRGRRIDAMIYFTDTFDEPPVQSTIEATAFECGMNRLPTMLFLAPKECMNDSFKRGVEAYADVIFFGSEELEIDVEEVENRIAAHGSRATI